MKAILLLFIFTQICLAGAGGGKLIQGQSASGRTKVTIRTNDDNHTIGYIIFEIDGKSYEVDVWHTKDNYGYLIEDQANQVFTAFVDNTQIDFKFWMVPNSKKQSQSGGVDYTFDAYVVATDPRELTKETKNLPLSPKIFLKCTQVFDL